MSKRARGHGGLARIEAKTSSARLATIQALYEMNLSGASADPVLSNFMETRWQNLVTEQDGKSKSTSKLAKPDIAMMAEIVRGVELRQAELDNEIEPHLSEDHTWERLELLLKAVLRAGAYEILTHDKTPARVIISEYVDVAGAFFGGNEPGLVNRTLERLAQDIRPHEMRK